MIALLLAAAVAGGPAIAPQDYRYRRALRPAGAGPVEVVPDGPLFAHTRPGFPDLRVVDARGAQVPWRMLPVPQASPQRAVPVLDSGRRAGAAVAILDLGPARSVVDRVVLDVPDARFVGSVTARGSDDRRTWTQLSTTQIYAVGGAKPARSTTALLPPTDFRYLELRATHVSRIAGAAVVGTQREPPLRPVPARARIGGSVLVDLGHAGVPVDELRISAATARYDRPFTVTAGGRIVATGRLVRVGAPTATVVPLTATGRFLRIRIDNGDSAPLGGIRVQALARPRTLLVEGGHRGPLTVYYGAPVAGPQYDFARLPRTALALDRARPGALGPEARNPEYRVVDRRSFFARHRSLTTAAIALAAAAVIAAAALALRRA